MFTKDLVKVLGEQIIITDEEQKLFWPRQKTKIPLNINDKNLLIKINKLGFEIIEFKKNIATILMPYYWIHFKLSKIEELIVDNVGRVRISIDTKNNKIELLKRFNYGIEILNTSGLKTNYNVVNCYFTDTGKMVSNINFVNENYNKLWIESGESIDNMVELCENECINILNTILPLWSDELAYWDEIGV